MARNECKMFVVFCSIAKTTEKIIFLVPLAKLADLNGEMLSFQKQDFFHISSDRLTTLKEKDWSLKLL